MERTTHDYRFRVESNLSENDTLLLDEDNQTEYACEVVCPLISCYIIYFMDFCCVVGILMNTLSFRIFSSPKFRRRSINVLLCGLCVSDLALCAFTLPLFSLTSRCFPTSSLTFTTLIYYLYPLAWMAQTMSVWNLVVITIDRWFAICKPFYARQGQSSKPFLRTSLIFILSVLYNIVRFWEYEIDSKGEVKSVLRGNERFMLYYQTIATSLLLFAIPLCVLSLLNFQIAREVSTTQKKRREIVTANERSEQNIAKMMVRIVLVFVFCYLLSFVFTILELCLPDFFKMNPIGLMLNELNNLLVVLNSSTSFIFYLQTSRYKKQLEEMFWGHTFIVKRNATQKTFEPETIHILPPSSAGNLKNGLKKQESNTSM